MMLFVQQLKTLTLEKVDEALEKVDKESLRKFLVKKENFPNARFMLCFCGHFTFDHNLEGKCEMIYCSSCKGLKASFQIEIPRVEITLDSKFWKLVEEKVKSLNRGY